MSRSPLPPYQYQTSHKSVDSPTIILIRLIIIINSRSETSGGRTACLVAEHRVAEPGKKRHHFRAWHLCEHSSEHEVWVNTDLTRTSPRTSASHPGSCTRNRVADIPASSAPRNQGGARQTLNSALVSPILPPLLILVLVREVCTSTRTYPGRWRSYPNMSGSSEHKIQ